MALQVGLAKSQYTYICVNEANFPYFYFKFSLKNIFELLNSVIFIFYFYMHFFLFILLTQAVLQVKWTATMLSVCKFLFICNVPKYIYGYSSHEGC